MLAPLDLAVTVLTAILRSYLAETTMDHVASALKKGGIKDLLTFFPPNRRSDPIIDAHFRGAGLPQVAEWWTRKQNALIKEDITKTIKEAFEREDQPSDVRVHFSSSGGSCRASVLICGICRSSLRYAALWRNARFPSLSSLLASGKALWLKSTGAHARTKSRALPCAKSRYFPFSLCCVP
jgi:hypothetical protein